MLPKSKVLDYLEKELNPELEAAYLEGMEEGEKGGLLPPEAEKEKRKHERLRSWT